MMKKTVKSYLIWLLSALCALFLVFGVAAFNVGGLTASAADPVTGTATSTTGKVELESFTMLSGASVKKTGEYQGIRFTTQISTDDLAKLPNNASFGTLILPENMLEGALTKNTENALDIKAYVWKDSSTSTMKTFTGVLTSISEEFYETNMAARSYVTYEDVNGVEYTVYAKNTQTRDLAYVASAALNAGETGDLLTTVVNSAAPALAFSSSSVSVKLGVPYTLTLAKDKGEALEISYVSANESVALVDDSGVVLGVGLGSTTITASANGMTAEIQVSVVEEIVEAPTWTDMSVNENIGYKSGAWTVSPTEAEMVAIGGVSGASYRGIRGNKGCFGYTHVKLLPTNTDSTYWEAYADYTLKFDWYYAFSTDNTFAETADVTSKVNVFGAESIVYAHSTWHTASIKISELLNVWSEVTSTTSAGDAMISNWLQFRWTSTEISDGYPGTVYFGNVRLEEPAAEVPVWNDLSSTDAIKTTANRWTQTIPAIPTASEISAIGGNGNASYLRVDGSAGHFNYAGYKILPANDKAYYEAYAGATVSFDWYYDVPSSDTAQYNVVPYGGTSAVYAQDTWHTVSIPMDSLLAEWDNLVDASDPMTLGTAWIDFNWTSGVSDLAGVLYIGNIRIKVETETVVPEDVNATVWTAGSTEKFLQNQTYSDYYTNTTLTFNAFKNEKESAQLMITPAQDIAWYGVMLSSLTNANGEVLSLNNFALFHQKYMEITEVTSSETTTVSNGKYPDALVPLAAAAKYAENTIVSGNNQGVWVTVDVPADQEAGVYTGTFILLLNGDTFEIPVSVTVYDYALSDETQTETRFSLSWANVEYAEGLYGGSATEEVQRAYYEYMLDMGISLGSLPGLADFYFHYNGTYDPTADVFADDFAFTYGGADYDGDGVNEYYLNTTSGKMEKYVEEIARYTLDDRCAALPLAVRTYEGLIYEEDASGEWVPVTKYTLTHTYNGTSYAIKSVDQVQLLRTVEELYKYSIENGVNLFEKLYLVLTWIDEFSNSLEESASADYNYTLLSTWFENCKNYLVKNASEYTLGEGVSETFRTQVLNSIAGLKVVTPTASPVASMNAEDTPFIWCPTIDVYHLADNREVIKNWVETAYGEGTPLWAYTCVNPSYPNPTYHLGDNLISSRLLSWMMYEYGITGNLYWSTMYIQNGKVDSTEYITDMYGNPLRSNEVNGDGFLIYPGSAYGVTGAIGSIRLQSISDGIEEYNLLASLENYAKARAAAKGETYDKTKFNSVLHMLTELLYSGTEVKYESGYLNNFANSREMLAELLVLAKNGIVLENSVTNGDTVVVTISAPEGVEFEINGSVETATANGFVTYTVTLSVTSDGSLDITTGSGEETEETPTLEIPTWTDMSVNSNLGYKSGAWTVSPTNDAMVAIGGVTGASYRGVQANEGYFGYTHVKLLPTNTDSTYWEAYADYTLKFDWYYQFATDRNFTAVADATSKVEVFGATAAVYAHSTWHTSSIKISELLNVWSEVTSTTSAGNEKVSNWLNFRWTGSANDNNPGTVYFGNIRIEAPVTGAVNVETTYFAETTTTPTIDLTSIYTANGGTESVDGTTATLTSVYGEVVETATPASFDVTAVPQGAYAVVLKKGSAVLMNATVDIYTAADGLVWVDMARLAALEDTSNVLKVISDVGEASDCTIAFVETSGVTYLTVQNTTTDNIARGIMLKALHSKAYYEQMYAAGYTEITLTAKSSAAEGYYTGNGTWPSSSGRWYGGSNRSMTISISNLIANWDQLHDFTNVGDSCATEFFFGSQIKNGSTDSFGNFSYSGSGSVALTPAVSASGAASTVRKELPNISLSMPLTAGVSYSETAWGSVDSSKTNATYAIKSSSLHIASGTTSYMSMKTLSSSNVVGGRVEGDYYYITPSSGNASYYHCFTLKASDKAAMEALVAECGDIELSFDVYFTISGTHSTTVRNCHVNGQVGTMGLTEGVWHTLSVKVSTLLENWSSLATTGGFSSAKCLFAINGTYGSETNVVNYYIGNFKLVEP